MLGHLVNQVHLGSKEMPVLKDYQDQQEILDHQDHKVLLEILDYQDH
jgi:hypothetical protein